MPALFKSECDALLSPIWDTLFLEEKRRILRVLIQNIDCNVKDQTIGLTLNGSSEALILDKKMKTEHYETRDRKRKELDLEPPIRKTLLLAHQIKTLVSDGKFKHPREMCPWININETRLDQIMNTLLLAPQIQKDILSNKPAINKITEYTIRPLTATMDWDQQFQQWQKILARA